MRVYRVRGFARFQRRERISDSALTRAVLAAEQGLVDADLGGGLIKQRIARPGGGKSGGFRTIIAWRRGDLAIYLLGFAKNERDNIDGDELDELKAAGRSFLLLSPKQIAALVEEETLMEVKYGEGA